MTVLTARPEIVFVDGDHYQVDVACSCGAGYSRMHRDDWQSFDELEEDERHACDLLLECAECEHSYALAEKAWDDEAELAVERLRDWQAERAHGGY